MFKKGDKIRRIGADVLSDYGFWVRKGEVYTVSECNPGGVWLEEDPTNKAACSDWEPSCFELVASNNLTQKPMSIIDKIKDTFISEPAKTYKQAGIYNDNLMPTNEGMALYIKEQMEKDKEFAAKVKKELEEANK